jgi:hypothetical protein
MGRGQERFLANLPHSCWAVVRHLEVSLQRFYLVNAVQSNHPAKVEPTPSAPQHCTPHLLFRRRKHA